MTRPPRRGGPIALAVALCAASARADLRADQLLLLVNTAVPESATLAEQYIRARHVPDGRVLRLTLPPGEDVSFNEYEAKIAKPVREHLATPAGQGVRCLVSFFGMPLRIGPQPSTPEDQDELKRLKKVMADLDGRAAALAGEMDEAAKSVGVTPAEGAANGVVAARNHIAETQRRVQAALASDVDPAHARTVTDKVRRAQQNSIAAAVETLGIKAEGFSALAQPGLQALAAKPRDATAREALRQQIAVQAGVFALYEVAGRQTELLESAETDAAVDNELALVRLDDYPRHRWQPNLLHYLARGVDASKMLMVSRIDAPTAVLAARVIDDSIKAEADGVEGKAVFDSRGLAPTKDGKPDGYGIFDQTVRDAAAFVRAKTKLTVVTDDREALISPRSQPGTALYCGWYSLRQYIPSCGFVRGAVAYHVASFELVDLHNPRERGWVANLLKDGVAATVGPVSEPYLSSFPRPDEFFPLLLTGRPTLAETYWATCPMTSWKQTLIGDPLYRPFAKRPEIAVKDLPQPLRQWVEKTDPAGTNGR